MKGMTIRVRHGGRKIVEQPATRSSAEVYSKPSAETTADGRQQTVDKAKEEKKSKQSPSTEKTE